MREIYVRPSEIVIAHEDVVIHSQALGSSLGICMYDIPSHIGGYVHSILPKREHEDCHDLKYVDAAILELYKELLKQGAEKEQLCAKLIGGAKLFQLPDHDYDVGKENIQSAYRILKQLQIPIAAEDVGDLYGRSIHFHVNDGIVMIETRNKHMYQI